MATAAATAATSAVVDRSVRTGPDADESSARRPRNSSTWAVARRGLQPAPLALSEGVELAPTGAARSGAAAVVGCGRARQGLQPAPLALVDGGAPREPAAPTAWFRGGPWEPAAPTTWFRGGPWEPSAPCTAADQGCKSSSVGSRQAASSSRRWVLAGACRSSAPSPTAAAHARPAHEETTSLRHGGQAAPDAGLAVCGGGATPDSEPAAPCAAGGISLRPACASPPPPSTPTGWPGPSWWKGSRQLSFFALGGTERRGRKRPPVASGGAKIAGGIKREKYCWGNPSKSKPQST